MVRPSAAAPSLPVVKKEDALEQNVVFDVFKVNTFNSPQYGATWRLHCVDRDGGDRFIMLFAANDVRDDTYGDFQRITDAGGTVDGCMLAKRRLAKSGRDTWEIVDAPPEMLAVSSAPEAPPKK